VERLVRATANTLRGLLAAFVSEQAFRQEVWLLVLAVPASLWLGRSWTETALLIGAVLVVMVAELLNTAVEKLADHVTPERHHAIGRVKDIGSAAVGVALVLAGLIWAGVAADRFAALP
jgi:diacylglycerol kinase (ATP)